MRLSLPALLLLLPSVALGQDPPRKLYITNSAGDDVTIVDVATHKVLRSLKVGPRPHGIAAPAKGDFILVTIEGGKKGELVWIDPRKDEVVGRMVIGSAPNQLAVTPDGKFAYIPVSDGHFEVVDVAAKKIVQRLSTGGRPHNTVCSADGKHMYLAPLGAPKKVFVAEVATHKIVADIPLSASVRPIALARDGRLFANVDGLVGIEVADTKSGKFLHRIAAELTPAQQKVQSRSHGVEVRPDQKELWECDVENAVVRVYDITGERPKQLASIPMPGGVYWITFDTDGRHAYASVRSQGEVVAVDTAKKEIVARIKTGKEPKRLLVVTP